MLTGKIDAVMRKHGLSMVHFNNIDKPEHWDGYCISNVFNAPSDEVKAEIKKKFDDAVMQIKVKAIENEEE